MIKKKFLAATVAACLAAVALIGGTFAYLQDSTKEVVNTFTVGNVKIDLEEPSWETDGNGNNSDAQNLVPGAVVAKDPQIHNDGTTN